LNDVERAPIAIALLALAIGTTPACRPAPPRDTTPAEELAVPVAAQPAIVGRVRAVLHASGIMVPSQGAEFLVVAPEPARIIDITKKEGDPVVAGEILVRLDIPSAAADAARQRADVARAHADFESARVDQARSRDLSERGLIARRDLEDANRAVADAQSAVTRAEAAQAAADVLTARAIVRAPFAGVVVALLHGPGDLVQGVATDPILRLVDTTRLEVSATVPVAELSRILPGASARLLGGRDGKPVPLTVLTRPGPGDAGPSGTPTVRLGPLVPTTLGVDTPVEVDIDLDERPTAVLVPVEAIIRAQGESALFVAVGDLAERRVVTLGVTDEGQVEVTSGLRAGELVITRGHAGLEDGAAISVDTGAR
jgi:membrane fusion protein, multidrug efflux system